MDDTVRCFDIYSRNDRIVNRNRAIVYTDVNISSGSLELLVSKVVLTLGTFDVVQI